VCGAANAGFGVKVRMIPDKSFVLADIFKPFEVRDENLEGKRRRHEGQDPVGNAQGQAARVTGGSAAVKRQAQPLPPLRDAAILDLSSMPAIASVLVRRASLRQEWPTREKGSTIGVADRIPWEKFQAADKKRTLSEYGS
jgi:hypothetical protein